MLLPRKVVLRPTTVVPSKKLPLIIYDSKADWRILCVIGKPVWHKVFVRFAPDTTKRLLLNIAEPYLNIKYIVILH